MTKRPLLLGLLGLGLLGPAGTANAQEPPDREGERAERARAIVREVVDLEASGRVRVMRERGLKAPRRPAVNAVSNVETFEPVTARFVRFNVLATISGDEPWLDALGIYGPDGPANLTAADGVRLTASSVYHGHVADFKGGQYVRGWRWVSKERGTG
jgi:hypothetical protein